MGNKTSSENIAPANQVVEGNSTIVRAIARGRVYVIIRYPQAVDEGTFFREQQFRESLIELQQVKVSYCVSRVPIMILNCVSCQSCCISCYPKLCSSFFRSHVSISLPSCGHLLDH